LKTSLGNRDLLSKRNNPEDWGLVQVVG
jgi:hypothetical protein